MTSNDLAQRREVTSVAPDLDCYNAEIIVAKRKKPTQKTIRQGQTIYLVYRDWQTPQGITIVKPIFVESDKSPLTPPGMESSAFPRWFVAKRLADGGNRHIYNSRRRAKTAAEAL